VLAPTIGQFDALVLAGGQSRRMGRTKALLPWQDTVLVEAVVHVLRPLFRRVLVISRADVPLPPVAGALVLQDGAFIPEGVPHGLRGPLVGIATGLAASSAPWCFVAACDMPFLSPALIHHMSGYLHGCEAVALGDGGYVQPLPAFYPRASLPRALTLLQGGVTSPRALLNTCQTRVLDGEQLGDLAGDRRAFYDVDTPQQYHEALQAVAQLR